MQKSAKAGVWFTTSPEHAKMFGGIKQVQSPLQNPLIVDHLKLSQQEAHPALGTNAEKIRMKAIREAQKNGNDGVVFKNTFDTGSSNRRIDLVVVFDPDKVKLQLGYDESEARDEYGKWSATGAANLKEWFGNSKVVDSNDNPLRVYHGTNKAFSEFGDQKDIGYWFAKNPGAASKYASREGTENVSIMPVYLRLENPPPWAKYIEANKAANKKFPNMERKDIFPEVVKILKEQGYDGLKANDLGGPTYMVFDREQIKSAIGNTGAFSKKEKSIAASLLPLFLAQVMYDEALHPRGQGGKWANKAVAVAVAVAPSETNKSSKVDWEPSGTVHPQTFINARDKSTKSAFLSHITPDDIKDHNIILSKDHTVGALVSPTGDIQNVFNNGGPKGAATEVMIEAIARGGKTLDCYRGFLPGYYSTFGFSEVGHMKFNREYAPPDWNYDKYGEPDVVFMALTQKREPDNARQYNKFWQETRYQPKPTGKEYTGAEWDTAKADSLAIANGTGTRKSNGQNANGSRDKLSSGRVQRDSGRVEGIAASLTPLFLEFIEDQHPRDDKGKFADKSGGSSDAPKLIPTWETGRESREKFAKQYTSGAGFKGFFRDSQAVNFVTKEPLEVYHGTLKAVNMFDEAQTNPENFWGQGIYFSNTPEDASNNYADITGPDKRNQMMRILESIQQQNEEENTARLLPEMQAEAEKKVGTEGNIIPAYLSMQKPIYIGDPVENLKGPPATKWDYDLDEKTGEPTGKIAEFLTALEDSINDFNESSDIQTEAKFEDVKDDIQSAFEPGDHVTAEKVLRIAHGSEGVMYADKYDQTDGDTKLYSNEIIRSALERMGYDGAVDRGVYDRWGAGPHFGRGFQGMTKQTIHYTVWHGEQVKSSRANIGTFDPKSKRLDLSNFFLELNLAFDPDQPRDTTGKWTATGASVNSSRDASIEPGTTPIPEGHIRAYHYTRGARGEIKPMGMTDDEYRTKLAENLRQGGIDIKKAIGESYGEPNVIWASTEKPSGGHVYAEFSVARDDPRWGHGFAPDKGTDLRDWEKRNNDFYFHGSIKPSEIIAVHEPWHDRYRYIMRPDNIKLREQILAGEHDNLLTTNEYGPAIRKFKLEHGVK